MRTVTVSGTTLYHVAAAELGDASQWIRIAVANGVTDPNVIGVATLSIPDSDPTRTGGLPPQ